MKLCREESKILNDNLSGSSEILEISIRYILSRLVRKNLSQTEIVNLRLFTKRVAEQHRPMKAVVNGMKEIERMLNRYGADSFLMVQNLSHYLDTHLEVETKILNNCERLFRKKVSVAVYSNSGMVKKVLSRFRSRIKAVYISESRPVCEGKIMAEFLSQIGLQVHFMVDMLLFEKIVDADYLILGADSVWENSFLNKIGSRALLENAGAHGIKRIVVFESTKLSQRISGHLQIQPPDEVWSGRHRGISIINRYFEIIPNSVVDTFVSDLGISASKTLHRWIKKAAEKAAFSSAEYFPFPD